MALDPDAKAFLDELAALGGPPIDEQSVQEARRLGEERAPILFGKVDAVARIEERTIPGTAGPIPVRIYSLHADAKASPVLVYFHGGGWVVGSINTHDGVCRALARRAGCLVVSVEYRRAPEHKFPAAVEDAWDTVAWLREHGNEVGADPERIAAGGDSAGGNLTAVVAVRARDRGIPLALQLMVYPVTDYNLDNPSYRDYADGYYLTRESMRWYWGHYLPGPAAGADPEASPLRARDLRGVAPALVLTCEYDPLRDEGEAYAARLRDAGVPVTLSRYDGMIHGFYRFAAPIRRAHAAHDESADAVRTAFRAKAAV